MVVSLSYVERQARAAETFAVFAPGVAAEGITAGMERRLGALGSLAFDVIGEMWARPQLSVRDRSLLVISVLAAQARDEELVLHTRIGLRNGVSETEMQEIVLQVAAYAGFPAAMAAIRRVDQGLREELGLESLPDRTPGAHKSDAERDQDAAQLLPSIAGIPRAVEPAQGLARMSEIFGDVGVTAYRFALGDIWSRPQLSRRDRSMIVIGILTWLGISAELEGHVRAGLRHGLSRVEIEEAVNHLALYTGLPRAFEAIRTVRAAFAQEDAGKG